MLLHGRLDVVGSGREPARGDAGVEKGAVVAAAVEGGRDQGEVERLEVGFEQVLDLGAAGGASGVEGGAGAVVYAVDVVWGGDHVEV